MQKIKNIMNKIIEIFKKINKPNASILLLILILIILFLSIGTKTEKLKQEKLKNVKKEVPVNVITMQLKNRTIYDKINLIAITKAWEDLKLQTQVAGEVIQKKVKEGDYVNTKDTLFVINKNKYKSIFDSANATYTMALANFNRTKNLYEKNITKKSDLESAKASMEQAKASMEIAKTDLENCNIKAPISGFINDISIEKGQILAVGSLVAQILNTKKIKVRVGIPENDITNIRNVKDFVVEIDALNKKFKAKKYFLSQGTDENVRLYALDLKIDNPQGEILDGMFARVDIIKRKRENCIVIPINAIITKGDKKIVYIEKEGKAHSNNIETGIQEGFMVEIKKGLSVGDNLIIIGQNDVSQNRAVKIIRKVDSIEELN